MSKAKVVLILVGVFSIIMAIIGLLYNAVTIFTDFSSMQQDMEIPYFYTAFYIMSVICIICYLPLLICGIQFVCLRLRCKTFFVCILVFEVVYFLSIGPMWLIPDIGMSIGAATGVANGGLVIQGITLFPL